MGQKHYNLVREKLPCSIVAGDDLYIYADYHTTTTHEKLLKKANEQWIMFEDRNQTICADTDGGCDRIEEITYEHPLKMENTIFENDRIVGFYYEYCFYNGYNSKPNAHIFMLDDPASFTHYNVAGTWRLRAK